MNKKRSKNGHCYLSLTRTSFWLERLPATWWPGKDSIELLPITLFFLNGKAVAVSCACVCSRQKVLIVLCRYFVARHLYKNVERIYKFCSAWSSNNPKRRLLSCYSYTFMYVCEIRVRTVVVFFIPDSTSYLLFLYISNLTLWRTKFKCFPLVIKTLQWDVKI